MRALAPFAGIAVFMIVMRVAIALPAHPSIHDVFNTVASMVR